jgi:hypothetical protein
VRSIEIGPWLGLALIVLVGAACTTTTPPSPRLPTPTTQARGSTPDAPASRSTASAGPSVAGINVPEPGRPFDAAMLLAAMRDSRRPGGVPAEIETDAVAAALADTIWTFDGRPWTTTAAGASCGPQRCTLEVAGGSAGAHGDDLWVFAVSPTTGSVEVVSSELRSLPADLLVPLDELARSVAADGSLAGMLLTGVRWLPPPDQGRFVMSYRSGGEEGSCRVDLTLDAADAVLVSDIVRDC